MLLGGRARVVLVMRYGKYTAVISYAVVGGSALMACQPEPVST